MKYTFGKLFLAVAAFAFLACSKDKCKDTKCENGGKCTDGTCQCPTGFTGSKCENKDIPGLLTRVTWKPIQHKLNGKIQTLDQEESSERIRFNSNGTAEAWSTSSPQNIAKGSWSYSQSSGLVVITFVRVETAKLLNINSDILELEVTKTNGDIGIFTYSPA